MYDVKLEFLVILLEISQQSNQNKWLRGIQGDK